MIQKQTHGGKEKSIILNNSDLSSKTNPVKNYTLEAVKYPFTPYLYAIETNIQNPLFIRQNIVGGAPKTPVLNSPSSSVVKQNSSLTFSWNFFSDFENIQEAYELVRVVKSVTEYWNGTSWDSSQSPNTRIVSGQSSFTLDWNSWAKSGSFNSTTGLWDQHTFKLRVWDNHEDENNGLGFVSEYSNESVIDIQTDFIFSVTTFDDKTFSVGTTTTVNNDSPEIVWSSNIQDSYKIEIYGDKNGINYDDLIYTSGWEISTNKKHEIFF